MSGWPRSFGSRWRATRARHDRIREAVNAARDISHGNTRAEIRGQLAAEFHVRGHTPPADPILDHMADQILSTRDPPGQIRLAARGMSILAEVGGKAIMGHVTAWRDVEQAEPEFARRVRALFDAHRHTTIATMLVVELWTPTHGLRGIERE